MDVGRIDDRAACRILQAVTTSQAREGKYQTELTPDVRRALQDAFGVEVSSASPDAAELARQSLTLLAEDPQKADAIRTLAAGPPPAAFAVIETAAVVTAVLIALQTHVRFEKDKDGRISIKIEKNPTSDSLLKGIVQKMLSYAGTGSSR